MKWPRRADRAVVGREHVGVLHLELLGRELGVHEAHLCARRLGLRQVLQNFLLADTSAALQQQRAPPIGFGLRSGCMGLDRARAQLRGLGAQGVRVEAGKQLATLDHITDVCLDLE